MFPIDPETADYSKEMIQKFDDLISPKGFSWKLEEILPQSLVAGADAGALTGEGQSSSIRPERCSQALFSHRRKEMREPE